MASLKVQNDGNIGIPETLECVLMILHIEAMLCFVVVKSPE